MRERYCDAAAKWRGAYRRWRSPRHRAEEYGELYDPATNTFAPSDQTASMNGARVGARATPLPNGKILIEGRFGSASASSTTELYTP